MADYWVSRDKYFCKYCNIYIADDKPVRPHSLLLLSDSPRLAAY